MQCCLSDIRLVHTSFLCVSDLGAVSVFPPPVILDHSLFLASDGLNGF